MVKKAPDNQMVIGGFFAFNVYKIIVYKKIEKNK